MFSSLFLLWCHTCNSECLRCCCCWRWWRWWWWFKLKDEYISVYSFLLLIWLSVHWTHATLCLCTKSVKREEAFEERRAFGRGNDDARKRTTLTNKRVGKIEKLGEKQKIRQNNTAHEPQITSIHQKYLRRLFYVLKFCFYILLVALTTCSHIKFYCKLFILCFLLSLDFTLWLERLIFFFFLHKISKLIEEEMLPGYCETRTSTL